MKIEVADSAEFKRLLQALVDELIDAHDYFRLHQDLNAAIPDYQLEFNQSAAFWTFTTRALMDAALIRLCRAYDPLDTKPNLTLRNFLDTIQANLHFFDEPNFRERLKANPFVNSLAAAPRKPDATQLQKDLVAVSSADPSVKKLITWRHMYFAHRSRSSALNLGVFATENFFPFAEIKALIDNGLRIVTHPEAAKYLGISTTTLYRYVEQEKIEFRKIGNRLEYRRSALDQFKDQHVRPARRPRRQEV